MNKRANFKRSPRETNPSVLRSALVRLIDRRIIAQGEIDFPCIPALLDVYVERLITVWEALGRRFSPEERARLRDAVDRGLETGYGASPYARLLVGYTAAPPPQAGIQYTIQLKEHTIEEHYAHWMAHRKPPLFGHEPDAKVLALAAELGDPREAPVLDIGAGTGRNAIPLARLGHPTHAIELVPELADEMRKNAAAAPVHITVGDVLDPEIALEPGRYHLVVVAEVISHFRDIGQVRLLMTKLAAALAPGGVVLISTFLAMEGYKPDALAREVSETAWSRIFTRPELSFLVDELAFDRISDESVHEYEKTRLPAQSWPPTGWFEEWSQGRNVFDLPAGTGPIDLRWLVYRRQ